MAIEEMLIKRFTAEDIKTFKEKFPEGRPKEWALIDTEVEGVMGFYDTEEEAKADMQEWRARDLVRDLVEESFREWADKCSKEVGIDREKVLKFVKDSL